jgi:hypothetical protein
MPVCPNAETGKYSGEYGVNQSEGDQRWALIGLLLWTPIVLGVIAGIVHLVGHWIFRIW